MLRESLKKKLNLFITKYIKSVLWGLTVRLSYTGCNRRNGPDFGRVFLMLKYTEKPQNTYIQI